MAELLNVVELKSIGLQAHRCMDLRTENLAFTAVHYMDRAAERKDATALIMDEWGAMAREWDRYWIAAGVGGGSIGVDDAIARWQAMEKRVRELEAAVRIGLRAACFWRDSNECCCEDGCVCGLSRLKRSIRTMEQVLPDAAPTPEEGREHGSE